MNYTLPSGQGFAKVEEIKKEKSILEVDGRAARGKRFDLAALLVLLVLAKLAGMQSLLGASAWIKDQQVRLRAHLHLSWTRVPISMTICDENDIGRRCTSPIRLSGLYTNAVQPKGLAPAPILPHARAFTLGAKTIWEDKRVPNAVLLKESPSIRCIRTRMLPLPILLITRPQLVPHLGEKRSWTKMVLKVAVRTVNAPTAQPVASGSFPLHPLREQVT